MAHLKSVHVMELPTYLKKFLRVGLGDGDGVNVLFFTGICMEGEKHCCGQIKEKVCRNYEK